MNGRRVSGILKMRSAMAASSAKVEGDALALIPASSCCDARGTAGQYPCPAGALADGRGVRWLCADHWVECVRWLAVAHHNYRACTHCGDRRIPRGRCGLKSCRWSKTWND